VAGAQTRQRLLDAAAEILACHGEPGLTLREVSAVAGSNVATVKYHFGSREGLVDEVITNATRSVVSAQLAGLDALIDRETEPSAEALIRAWATPLVRVATSLDEGDRRLGRIIAQGQASPGMALDRRFREATAVPTERLFVGLAHALPQLDAAEVMLRIALMVSALSGLASGVFDAFIAESDPSRELHSRVLDRLIAVATA
jgi:AcrR family transcriptional regulator